MTADCKSIYRAVFWTHYNKMSTYNKLSNTKFVNKWRDTFESTTLQSVYFINILHTILFIISESTWLIRCTFCFNESHLMKACSRTITSIMFKVDLSYQGVLTIQVVDFSFQNILARQVVPCLMSISLIRSFSQYKLCLFNVVFSYQDAITRQVLLLRCYAISAFNGDKSSQSLSITQHCFVSI